MNITVQRAHSALIVSLAGGLAGHGEALTFAKTVRDELAPDDRVVVVDFREAGLPDSMFLGRMLELRNEQKKRGILMYLLCGKNEKAIDLFQVTCIDRAMPFISSLDDIPVQ